MKSFFKIPNYFKFILLFIITASALTFVPSQFAKVPVDPQPTAKLIITVTIKPNDIAYTKVDIGLWNETGTLMYYEGIPYNSNNIYTMAYTGDVGFKYQAIADVYNKDNVNIAEHVRIDTPRPLPANGTSYTSTIELDKPVDSPPKSTDANSCLTYDPGYTKEQTAEVFSCDTSSKPCSGINQAPYTSTSYNKCNGGVCCYNTVKYAARKIQPNGTVPPATSSTTPSAGSPAPSGGTSPTGGRCANKDGVNTNFSKPDGYEGPTCDHRLIGTTDPKTAKPGRVYADRYRCNKTGSDNTNYEDVLVPTSNKSCDSYPWIDAPAPSPSICTATMGLTCKLDSKGKADNTTGPCCMPNQNLECTDPVGSGFPTCKYIGGKPPTPTPGSPTTCAIGFKGTGCPCLTGASSCGCASTHNPEPSVDNPFDPSKYFCMPFASGLRWCENTKTAMPSTTDPAICKGSTPYSTPTPVSRGCPNDGNHLCVDTTGTTTNQCIAGYGPSNDSVANTDCAGWNPSTPTCYLKGAKPSTVCTVTPIPSPTVVTSVSPSPTSKPVPAASGCPNDNGDGRVNNCLQTCGGSYPTPRTVGNADCEAAYGTIRGACCTSN